MKPYKDWAPTGHDHCGAFLDDDRQHWLVCPVMQTRDSGPLDQSNFASFLEGLGGEGNHVEVHRFGHWGPGWFEIIIVDPAATEIISKAREMQASLENYPALDEDDYSKREYEDFEEAWESWGRSDYERGLANERLPNELDADFTSPRGFNLEDLCDAVSELGCTDTDELAHAASRLVSWHYQPDGDGISINIDDLVRKTNLVDLIARLDQHLFDKAQRSDIARLCKYIGASATTTAKAVEQRITSLTRIRQLESSPV